MSFDQDISTYFPGFTSRIIGFLRKHSNSMKIYIFSPIYSGISLALGNFLFQKLFTNWHSHSLSWIRDSGGLSRMNE